MRLFIYIISMFVLLVSCKKDKAADPFVPEEIDYRKKFEGTYKVYNENQNYLYDMRIGITTEHDTCSIVCEGLTLHNFANKFDSLWGYHSSIVDNNHVSYNADHGVKDYQGNSWSLSKSSGINPYEFNTLNNDTIIFRFTLSNIAFYISEGQTYFECECVHIAIKQ